LILRGTKRDEKRRCLKEISLRVFGNDKDYDERESIETLEKELFRCLGSYNPFDRLKAPLLKERLEREKRKLKELKEEEEKRLEREERKLKELKEEEEKLRQQEQKTIYYTYDDESRRKDIIDSMYITRDIFQKWLIDNKDIRKAESWEKIKSFEELEEGGMYIIEKRLVWTNFDSYAVHEADVQTRDCIEAIRKGQVFIPPFNEEGTIVIPEFAIYFGKELNATDWKINSPIVPDAIMIHGTKWLILECKHSFNNKFLKLFDVKCDFIKQYADQKWVHKNFPIPTDVVRVACSITDFSPVPAKDVSPEMIKLVRDGQAYKRVDS
jgi:hypothetical protein